MNSKFVFLLIVVGIVLVSGCTSGTQPQSGYQGHAPGSSPSPQPGSSSENTVMMTSSGFEPSTITISVGESVTWVNNGSFRRPASDIHPTHTVYPGSGISKCGGPEEDAIFDACGGVQPGNSYTFTFNEPGNWEYHDHLSPSNKGTVIVQ